MTAAPEPDDASRISRVAGYPAHGARAAAVAEVHSRPHPMLAEARMLIQLAFVTEGGSVVDSAVMTDLCKRQGATPPQRLARHHVIRWGDGALYWERHSEFSTYMWDAPLDRTGDWRTDSPFGEGFSPPGAVMSGVRLEVLPVDPDEPLPALGLDPESLCHSLVEGGKASIVTDFHPDADGLTRMYILDRGLSQSRRGALAQKLIEIETYRVFCMLGLSLAQSLSGPLRRMEDSLAAHALAVRSTGRGESERLLGHLTDLSAELEAQAASCVFRFGASRAYYNIVTERLQSLDEVPCGDAESWSQFLTRRVAPAMRTCRSVEERQSELSRKLARTTGLLRTWVDVEMEQQNRNLLASMNDRARLQLRLQQTVEGLSVAAISYYVVGLASYLLAGLPQLPGWPAPKTILSVSVPLIVLTMALIVRRIRRRHTGDPEGSRMRGPDSAGQS